MSSATISEAQSANSGVHAGSFRDFITLTKPRITLMVVITAAGGMWLAPGAMSIGYALWSLLGMALIVGSANGLNMWLERDVDRHMTRTRRRPLPSERMDPMRALVFSAALALVAVPFMTLGVNPMTGALGTLALVLYVAVYTPMKQLSPAALLVGAVPGALPPLMGWTAATGSLDWPGVVLFGVLFTWQMPHFIAISIFRKEEYERAGLKVLPSVRGDQVARYHAVAWAVLTLAVSLILGPGMLGVAGWGYMTVAALAGGYYLVETLRGLRDDRDGRWAFRVFKASLLHLPVVFAALMIDAQ